MPKYRVAIIKELRIITERIVTAKNKETATHRVNQQIKNRRFGILAWEVKHDTSHSAWIEEDIATFIDGVEEE